MKFNTNGKNTPYHSRKKILLLVLTPLILTIIPLCLLKNSDSPLQPSDINVNSLTEIEMLMKCDIFSGKWVPFPQGPYYTNATCRLIIDQQNCIKFGRPDTEYMKWRWRPEECELPFFSAVQFLKLVRGKKMAFVGDSVGRNQMQSLLCLLARAAYAEEVSHRYASDTAYFKWWYYADYRFTLATLWSPFLVKARDADHTSHSQDNIMNLYLDQADEAWTSQVKYFDYVIISAGHWFFRPLMFYANDKVVGCHNCNNNSITEFSEYYAYRMAFRTAFKTLLSLKRYKGITFLRTFSPSHFENGEWNTGGKCVRTRPFTSQEINLDGFALEFYLTQVEELKKAEEEGKKRGLKFRQLATTEAMLLRPDGHPNHYGQSPDRNTTIADCVHWCMPGPIDTWNEFLLYMLRREALISLEEKLQKITQ